MSAVVYQGQRYDLPAQETVLDTLLSNNHAINHGCRSGVCQACVLVADNGTIPSPAQTGLSETQKKLNYFLSCQCAPSEPLEVRQPSESISTSATIVKKTWLNDTVIQLLIRCSQRFEAGQYMTLCNAAGVARSYSIANTYNTQQLIEFHIKVLPNGAFSQWLANSTETEQTLDVVGPIGKCIYSAAPDQNLLLASMGTGMAPMLGIVREAITQQHQGKIDVYIGSRHAKDFYLTEQWQAITAKHPNIHTHFICLEGNNSYAETTDIYKTIAAQHSDLKGYKVFLCGNESFVRKLRKQSFLAGAGMADISADTFLPFSKSG